MSKKTFLNPTALVFGSAFLGSIVGMTVVSATENPFDTVEIVSGYSPTNSDTKTSGDKGTEAAVKEGKCGEGKCGGDKSSVEGKCGEGKCGGMMPEKTDPGGPEFLEGDPCKINSNLPQCF